MKNWEDVVALACSLPDVEMASFYGKMCPKVRGKAFVSPGREPDSFHVMSPHEEKAVLLETDPDTFWQTPHYEGWPGLLVRYGSADPERVKRVITRAWWDRASKAQRAAFGERP
ncbi:MAG: MmcQ/YjbR family DNA-binding protein [Proteobacteria bacterium]|nr:MmcQ/YjbR family DNA-binding protein [Pseudomonadota bacterium]